MMNGRRNASLTRFANMRCSGVSLKKNHKKKTHKTRKSSRYRSVSKFSFRRLKILNTENIAELRPLFRVGWSVISDSSTRMGERSSSILAIFSFLVGKFSWEWSDEWIFCVRFFVIDGRKVCFSSVMRCLRMLGEIGRVMYCGFRYVLTVVLITQRRLLIIRAVWEALGANYKTSSR